MHNWNLGIYEGRLETTISHDASSSTQLPLRSITVLALFEDERQPMQSSVTPLSYFAAEISKRRLTG